ncbi:unnamed protein product [Prunus armeniaca]|uniref:Uncharacterized protein n=1 Tax=Prunus armeniaca TaxID=36596 RepID=A0A6J5UHS7_PRUAR|nr:unnamed protein product [Prunus armeniaca]
MMKEQEVPETNLNKFKYTQQALLTTSSETFTRGTLSEAAFSNCRSAMFLSERRALLTKAILAPSSGLLILGVAKVDKPNFLGSICTNIVGINVVTDGAKVRVGEVLPSFTATLALAGIAHQVGVMKVDYPNTFGSIDCGIAIVMNIAGDAVIFFISCLVRVAEVVEPFRCSISFNLIARDVLAETFGLLPFTATGIGSDGIRAAMGENPNICGATGFVDFIFRIIVPAAAGSFIIMNPFSPSTHPPSASSTILLSSRRHDVCGVADVVNPSFLGSIVCTNFIVRNVVTIATFIEALRSFAAPFNLDGGVANVGDPNTFGAFGCCNFIMTNIVPTATAAATAAVAFYFFIPFHLFFLSSLSLELWNINFFLGKLQCYYFSWKLILNKPFLPIHMHLN